ncbi:MAG: IspD/TarI family cytidylyltransferase [Candidatus Sumerlaeota bacterium]|nr:IspD/TarI family cytidylyltransferase [Candidatus Sumerlaeota bacterium]
MKAPPGEVAAVVVAAGEGRRMGAERPKQFLPLGGRAVFLHSLEFFLRLPEAKQVCLVLGAQELNGESAQAARTLAAQWAKPLLLARGAMGATREAIAAARECGGAVLAAPAIDTVKQTGRSDFRIERTLDRSRLWMAQTPQAFRFADLLGAMEAAERDGVELTDEAIALERLGREVRIVPSTDENLKITVPADLARAERMLVERNERPGGTD